MGESSAPRRPTHDTNTSRRQVSTHTHQQQQQHFIKYKHTMKFTGLIASTLMLLLAVMASTASARSIISLPPEPQYCCNAYNAKCESCKEGLSEEEFCRIYPTFSGCPTPTPVCCNAYNAECEACKFGITVEEMCRVHEEDMAFDSFLGPLDEFCRRDPHSHVCPQKPTKPSHPDNCYSTIWNTEIIMARWVPRSAAGTETGRASLSARRKHLILITATPRFGTRKCCMVRWVPRSAAGRETGRASLSANDKFSCFFDYIPLAQFLFELNKKARVNFCRITF